MVNRRGVLNAIRSMAPGAGGWRLRPVHFGPSQMIDWGFRRLVRRVLFRTIHDVALMLDREAAGREANPTTAGPEDRRSSRGHLVVEIVRRPRTALSFEVIPQRPMVERILAG